MHLVRYAGATTAMKCVDNLPDLILTLTSVLAVPLTAGAQGSASTAKLIVSGASGGLAGETIHELLARGVQPADLILVTRTPQNVAQLQARGASVRKGDFTQPDSLPEAFACGARMLLISTSGGDRVAQHTNAINAARKAGVHHIVYTSYVAVEKDPAAFMREHRLTEEALRNSGMTWTLLRNQLYADRLFSRGARALAGGEFITNAADARWAPVTRKDIAAAAAAVLAGPGHENKVYVITGPETITDRAFVALLTEVTGKPVKVIVLADQAYIDELMKSGMPEPVARITASFGAARREGYLDVTSTAVQDLTGRPARSIRELLIANKAALLSR